MSFVQIIRYLTESRLTQESECFMFRSTWSCCMFSFFSRIFELTFVVEALSKISDAVCCVCVCFFFFRSNFVCVFEQTHFRSSHHNSTHREIASTMSKIADSSKISMMNTQLRCWHDDIQLFIWFLLHTECFCVMKYFDPFCWLWPAADQKVEYIYQIDYKCKYE